MSIELISVLVAVLAIGVVQAGLILTSSRGLRQDMRQDMAQMETRLREDILPVTRGYEAIGRARGADGA